MLSSKLLEELREHWRRLRRSPKIWLFPGRINHCGDRPIDTKTVWHACSRAARRAGLQKRVHPHTLRKASAYYTTFQSLFILKTIGLGQVQSAAVYGRSKLPAPEPAQLAIVDPFDR
jgi:integrase